MDAIIATAAVPPHSRLTEADTVPLPVFDAESGAAGMFPADVEIAKRVSDFLQDDTAPTETRATMRAGIRRMVDIAEAIALLTTHQATLVAGAAARGDAKGDAVLARLAEHPVEGPEVEFVVMTRAELAEREWLAYGRGVKDQAGVGLDEPWPTASVTPLDAADVAARLAALRTQRLAGGEEA